jgi:hypothetical protein
MAADGSRWQSRERAESKLALALASGATWRQAAADAGLTERTAYRIGDDPAFRAKVDALAASGWRQAAAQIEELTGKAAMRLGDLLDAEDARVSLAAAKTILDTGAKVCEHSELVERIEQLEHQRGLRAVS